MNAADILAPVTLSGEQARLEFLSADHTEALKSAVGNLWQLRVTAVPQPDGMAAEVERRLGLHAKGSMLPFTVFDAVGKIVGMTTFMAIDAVNRRVGHQRGHCVFDLRLGCVVGEPDVLRDHAGLAGQLSLAGHVQLAGLVVADEYRRQADRGRASGLDGCT